MLNKLFEIWYPRYYQADKDSAAYLRLLIGLSYLGLGVESLYLVLNLVEGIPVFPTNASLLGFFGLLCVIRFAKSYVIVAHTFLALFCSTILGLCLYYQSFPYTVILWAPVFAIFSVYLTGKKSGSVWSFFLGLLLVIFFITANSGENFGYQLKVEQVRAVASVTVILTMATALYGSILFCNYISKLGSELVEKNLILLEQKKQVEESVKEKQLLISLVCHDIANPLSAISLAISSAEEREPSDLQPLMQVIRRSIDSITAIVYDVNRMQAIELGKYRLELEAINLVTIFAKIESLFSERLKDKNLTLAFDYEKEDSLWVQAEEESLINSVLSNLMSNAIKFSEADRPIVVQAREYEGEIKVFVKDFGIGMPANLVEDLFKQYKPTSRLGTNGEVGTGFGMPITHAYMNKYGGDIAVFSQEKSRGAPNHGTTFMLSFKRAQSHKREPHV